MDNLSENIISNMSLFVYIWDGANDGPFDIDYPPIDLLLSFFSGEQFDCSSEKLYKILTMMSGWRQLDAHELHGQPLAYAQLG